ncbi:ClpP-like prohead protease/major capsid protein fusion protein [Spongiibacter marinus]|uniref:ClpP-like prohead protease/major capsid protein fusion protein n=1 Tax=Spongiibacter marinus TaxID=354246 RepID=UPI0019610772|nr:ClpP-like prohead protease/major capsid protein fusion protein [Spongiibacter marinus]MBM7424971.1 ATP-dependent Clp endopeptidase proteolytic subunit ClpP [Spongiibacter marinus]
MSKHWYSMAMSSPQATANKTAEIHIYGYVGGWDVSARQFAKDLKELGELDEIALHINSPGGSVFEGTAIYNLLKNHKAKIETHIDGIAASMGSVIALAGDTVHIAENAYFMIHNPSGVVAGEEKDMKKAADLLAKIKTTMVNLYSSRSGMSEEEVIQAMDEETWYAGTEAVEAGFADFATEAQDLAACFDPDAFNGFNKTPDAVMELVTASADPVLFPSAVAGTQQTQEVKPMKQAPNTPAATAAKAELTAEQTAQISNDAVANYKAAQAKRKADINAVFEGFTGHEALQAQCLNDENCDSAQAKDKLLAAIGDQNKQPGQSYSVVVGEHAGIKTMMAHAENAIAARALGEARVENNQLAGHTMYELARAFLHARSVPTGHMDKMALVAAAFTHSSGDFTTVLGNIAYKAMLKGYEEASETFQLFTSVGSFSDFKVHTRTDLGSFPSLRPVAAGAEYKYVTLGERAETAVLATYGELFGINRQAIINDDLSLFTRLPMKMGRAAIRTVGDLVFDVFINNPAMADGKSLFHADHGNLATASAINTASVDAARVKMANQKDGDAILNLRPKFLLCGTADEGAARVAMQSEFEVGASAKNNTVPNSVRGIAEVISDARLANHNGWYLLADQNMHDTIEVQYLDGQQAPVLEQQQGWNVDGTEFKVRMDAAAKAWDYRGMVKTPKS